LCGDTALVLAFSIPNSPYSVGRLLSEPASESNRALELEVWQCPSCGFVQLLEEMPQDYYHDYEMTVSFSPLFNEYLNSLAETFMSVCGIECGRVAEIGCGDGTFLKLLEGHGFDAVGVEPSRTFRSVAVAKDLTVYPAFVERESPVPGGPYDAVLSRQVLEHVFDVNGFLSGMQKSLCPNGVGLIEVPSLETAVRDKRYYDFFPDHVNYFSAETLACAIESNGMSVLDIRHTMNDEYLTAFIKAEEQQDRKSKIDETMPLSSLVKIGEAVTSNSGALIELLAECRVSGKKIAVWGSGGKGVVVLAAARILPGDISYLVDSDPRKQGLFTPVSHIEIHPPERLASEIVDIVLVTALAHLEEIVLQIRDTFGFRGQIAILDSEMGISYR